MTRRRPVAAPLAGAAALTLLAACGGSSPEPQAAGSPVAEAHAHPLREVPRASRSAPRIGTPLVIVAKAKPRRTFKSVPAGFNAWAHSQATFRVFRCESHWNPRAVNPSGKYRGLIQADATFWASWGGLRYAPRPDLATTGEQLQVAYRAWKARSWEPWTCARIVGVR